ncbi:extracellular solute-binding protein [bacterium]|nr:extracellular solute-binding protein [bacterium]
MKKVTIFLSIFLLFFLVFAEKKSVTVWHSYRGDEQTALEKLRNDFNESQSEYKVDLLNVPYDAFANKLTSAIPRGNGPDAFIFAHERVGDWAESGIISDLSDVLSGNVSNSLIPSTLDALKYNGKYWGFPLSFKSAVLFYRTDKVEKIPETTDELLKAAQSFTDAKNGKYGLAFEATSAYFAASFIYGFGGKFCFENGAEREDGMACLDDKGNVKALEFIDNLVNKSKVTPQEATSALVTQLFNEGNSAFVINGPWFLGEIDKNVPYSVAVLPKVSESGEVMKPFLTVEAYLVSNHETTNKKGAAEFGKFLVSHDAAKVRAVTGRQSVATASVYEDEEVATDEILNVFKKQAEVSVPMSNNPKMRMVWEPLAGALRKILRGADTAENALDGAQQQFKIFSKPLPAAQSPVVFVIILVVAALAGLVFTVRQIKKYKFFEKLISSPTPYIYLFPAMFSMLVLVFVPFAVGTAVAFFAHKSGEYQFVGFTNFISILLSRDFPITDSLSFYFTLLVTILWTAVNVFLHVSIGLALALMLREPWLKLKGVYRMLLIIPWAVPNYITALIWKGMFNRQFGAINGILQAIGLEPISWFSGFWTSFAANVTTNTWLGFPFMMVTALGALQAIPHDLEDAASVDGANGLQRFRHVILPLLKPALLPAVILGSVWTFNMFNIIYLVSGGEPDGATEILISEAYKWAFQRQERYGYAAAYSTLIFIVLLLYSKATEKVGKEN